MKSPRIFALATSIIAITLSMTPTNAHALTRAGGDKPVKYMATTAAPSSLAGAIIEAVSIVFSPVG